MVAEFPDSNPYEEGDAGNNETARDISWNAGVLLGGLSVIAAFETVHDLYAAMAPPYSPGYSGYVALVQAVIAVWLFDRAVNSPNVGPATGLTRDNHETI